MYANTFWDAGQVPILRYFEACSLGKLALSAYFTGIKLAGDYCVSRFDLTPVFLLLNIFKPY